MSMAGIVCLYKMKMFTIQLINGSTIPYMVGNTLEQGRQKRGSWGGSLPTFHTVNINGD